jgi:drug/metabolite transporter (DMT)-like permease
MIETASPSSSAARTGRLGGLWRSPYLLLCLAPLFWSGNFIVGRAVHGVVPPVALAFWRWTGGLALVLPIAWPYLRRDLPTLLRHWRVLLLLSAFGIAAFNTLVYLGLQSTTAINALLLQSAMPLIILLCSYLLFRERPRKMQLVGVLVSLVGVVAIASRGSLAVLLGVGFNIGDAWILAAVVSYALYSTLLRARPPVHAASFLAASFALGALMLLPFLVWEERSGAVMPLGFTSLLAVGYVALFPGFLAYLCYNRGTELIGANRAGQFMHLMPVFGSALAIAFLGEVFQAYHALGIGLIALGIIFASFRTGQP